MNQVSCVSIPDSSAKFPEHIPADFRQSLPNTLTIITTYQCNAACTECCFECNPGVDGHLSLDSMKRFIDLGIEEFPGLKLVAFSGGECFLLKQDLFEAIAHAHRHSLRTRCVTNAFWGKTRDFCRSTVRRLVRAGIDEINISTGRDHQQWVPVQSVIRAARTLVESGVVTLVTVEMEPPGGDCLQRLANDPDISELLGQPALFRLQCNSWMPFHDTSPVRGELKHKNELRDGCSQLFHNVTVTPRAELAACCGLTMEHIPEMKLCLLGGSASMRESYYGQLEDFLKIWIHIDGPYTIITRLFGREARKDLEGVVHICQACAILHKHPAIRARLKQRYMEFVPDVMSRFYLRQSIDAHSVRLPDQPVHQHRDEERSP